MKAILTTILLSLLLLQGCALLQLRSFSQYDQRSFTVSTVSLFHQRIPPLPPHSDWKGDWLFRRHRLELMDQSLFSRRPDLLIFQQLMARRGSPSESDKNILGYGSLDGYQWDLKRVRTYEDTQEEQYMATVTSLPLKIVSSLPPSKSQRLGKDGYVAATPFTIGNNKFLVINVEMPLSGKATESAYEELNTYIRANLVAYSICRERLIVGGFFPSKQNSPGYDRLLAELQLKESSDGYCELATDCETRSLENDLLRVSSPELSGSQVDHILVPTSAVVYSGEVAFDNLFQETSAFKYYGIERVWPTRRFGWISSLRLKTCG